MCCRLLFFLLSDGHQQKGGAGRNAACVFLISSYLSHGLTPSLIAIVYMTPSLPTSGHRVGHRVVLSSLHGPRCQLLL